MGRTFLSSLLFFFFSFSFRLVLFLVIAVLFCFFKIILKIFGFINFLLYCLILPFPRRPLRGPAIYVFLVISRVTVTGCYAFFKSEKELNGEREAYEH